jgi:hypothetical protein
MSAASEQAGPSTVKPRRLPSAIAFCLALGLVWLGGQFVRQGISDALLASRPELSVLWLGESPDALAQLARQRLASRDAGNAARLAARSLRRSPLNGAALATYGLAMERLDRPRLADAAMTLAGARGWRDLVTQIWLLRRDLLAARYPGAVDHADALLRRIPSPPPIVFAVLATAARDPRAIAPIADRLAVAPTWRPAFFTFLAEQAQPSAADISFALLTRLAAGPTPPTDAEIGAYLRVLLARGRYREADQAWRRLSPLAAARSGGVHDGDFEQTPGSTPFDWSLSSGIGWTASVADSPSGGGKALNVAYDGVSPAQPLRQLLVLAPGAYRLSGRFYDEAGGAAPLFAWTLECVGADRPLATAPTPAGPAGVWRGFSVDLTVPPTGCDAQWLTMGAHTADARKDTSVWYDDLAATPIGGAAPKPQISGVPPAPSKTR